MALIIGMVASKAFKRIAEDILRGNFQNQPERKVLPHYGLDGNIDGVDVFDISEQSEFIPIMVIAVCIALSVSPEDENLS
jgi:hypothetical protein